jgi:ribosomal protein L21E
MRGALPDKEWKKQVKEYQNGQRTQIEINPEGWQYKPTTQK